MIAIRGATTVDSDQKELIEKASIELFDQMLEKNSIASREIVSLTASTTADIKSFYPVAAIREAGHNIPLFSTLEPSINGGLKLCIRFLLFVEKESNNFKQKHIYLNGAKNLRRDLSIINIAIDGPSGSGKSTVAKLVAQMMSIQYVDTGEMYRAYALYMLENSIDANDEIAVEKTLEKVDFEVKFIDGIQHTLLSQNKVKDKIRTQEVSMAASIISKYNAVRVLLTEKQRQIAKNISCVFDGRDIGTFVLPNAEFKFYLTADINIRAKRRYNELIQKYNNIDYKVVLDEMKKRDFNDSNRKIAPLSKADDAVLVDTSNITAIQAAEIIVKIAGGKDVSV